MDCMEEGEGRHGLHGRGRGETWTAWKRVRGDIAENVVKYAVLFSGFTRHCNINASCMKEKLCFYLNLIEKIINRDEK